MKRPANPLVILLVLAYAALMLAPIGWMLLTSVKNPGDIPANPPGLLPSFSSQAPPSQYWFRFSTINFADQFSGAGISRYAANTIIVASASTLASVLLGTFAAYGFSRFRMPGSKDWQFFILSTRMLPALAVALPISKMYRAVGLYDSLFGLILLYTCFNLSFSTWMMKAFIDEIPTAYEEAALLDGYSRLQVLFKIIFPQAITGLLATAVFCLIVSWNEYAFALTLTATHSQTLPVYLAALASSGDKIVQGRLAAGAVLFMTPIVIFSLLMRKHLLRGVTFGAVKG